tara:strand:- start:17348 stop:18325 length:978 start_codon:yes stop_codon:yes gene_type:complete
MAGVVGILLILFLPLRPLYAAQLDKLFTQIEQLKQQGEQVYVLVPKSEDTFFTQVGKACEDEAQRQGVHCLVFATDRVDIREQVNVISALMKTDIDGLAFSAVKAEWIKSMLGDQLASWNRPLVAFDVPVDFSVVDSYVGTDDFALGKRLALEVDRLRPQGGRYCIQSERADSSNHSARVNGIQAVMQARTHWQFMPGCPIFHQGDYRRAVLQLQRLLEVEQPDAMLLTGGGAQFQAGEYRQALAPYRQAITSGELIIAGIDTVPDQLAYLRDGLATVNVGQQPEAIGRQTLDMLNKLANGDLVNMVIYTGLNVCRKDNTDNCLQ